MKYKDIPIGLAAGGRPQRHTGDWRSFNWTDSRAREAVGEHLGVLRALEARGECVR